MDISICNLMGSFIIFCGAPLCRKSFFAPTYRHQRFLTCSDCNCVPNIAMFLELQGINGYLCYLNQTISAKVWRFCQNCRFSMVVERGDHATRHHAVLRSTQKIPKIVCAYALSFQKFALCYSEVKIRSGNQIDDDGKSMPPSESKSWIKHV